MGRYKFRWLADLYVANGVTGSRAPNKLFVNQDGKNFNERGNDWRVDDTGTSLGIALGDYDPDGTRRIRVERKWGEQAIQKQRIFFFGYYTHCRCRKTLNGSYIPLFFDSDSDGDLDLFVSAMSYYEDVVESIKSSEPTFRNPAHLYRNNGKDRFSERAVEAGLGRLYGASGSRSRRS